MTAAAAGQPDCTASALAIRRFSITIQHLNKLLSKVEASWKWAKKIDNEKVREKALEVTLKKLQDAIDFHDLMTNADLKNLYRAVERQGSVGKTAHSDYRPLPTPPPAASSSSSAKRTREAL